MASDKGGGLYAYGSSTGPTVRNCVITNNSANTGSDSGGGGVHCTSNAGLKLVNCTIAGNLANTGGGALRLSGSAITVTNCILWDNTSTTGDQEIRVSSGSPTVTYSDVKGSDIYTGTGNINDNPNFVDPTLYDYHLQNDSPCVDRGLDSAIPADSLDIDGQTRIQDAADGEIPPIEWILAPTKWYPVFS